MSEEFHEIDALTLGKGWQFAADKSRIGFSRRDNDIELFDADSHKTVSVDIPLADFELDRYLVCLSGDNVTALTTSEVELWTQTVSGATDVVGLGAKDVLAVITVDGEVVGLDLETGRQLFETTRPHSDLTNTQITGGNGYLCIAAWSFVVCFDAAGEVLVDKNLHGAVEDVSILDDNVVVILKGGNIVAFDAKSGEQQWSNSVSARHLSPCGNRALPALTDSGLVLIHAEGRIEEREIDAGNRIIAAVDRDVLGIADETSVRVYRHGPTRSAQLDADLLTERVNDNSPIRAYIENTADTRLDATVLLETPETVSLESEHSDVALAPGESREIAYRLTEIPDTDSFECLLSVDSEPITKGTVTVDRSLDPEAAIAVESNCSQITGDTATIRFELENTSNTDITEVRLNGETVGSIPAKRSVSVERQYPLDGTDRTVAIEVTHLNATGKTEETVTIPKEPISVEISTGPSDSESIDVAVEPTVSAAITGEIAVQLDTEQTVSQDLSLAAGEKFRLAIIPLSLTRNDGVKVTVTSPLLGKPIERQLELVGGQPATENQGEYTEAPVTIERRVPETVGCGEKFSEQVRVTNRSEQRLERILLSGPQCDYELEYLDPGEQRTLQREHALFETGEIQLPSLRAGDASTDDETVIVRETGIDIQVAAFEKQDRIEARFTVRNESDQNCQIRQTGIEIGPNKTGETWKITPPVTVQPNGMETVERCVTLPVETELERDTRTAIIGYSHEGRQVSYKTLAPLRRERRNQIELDFLERSQFVSGKQCIVELALKNDGSRTLTDIEIIVEGESVLKGTLSQNSKKVEKFAPSDQETLLVDIDPPHSTQTALSVTVEGGSPDGPITEHWEFSGPVAETEMEWEQGAYIEQWQDSGGEQSPTVNLDQPHLVTRFHPTEVGSHH